MTLQRYILKRLLLLVPVLFGVSVITFSIMHLVPGDIIDIMIGLNPEAEEAVGDELRAEYNLDRPLWEQYLLWLKGALLLDFGQSPILGDISEVIATRLPATVLLGAMGWVIAIVIAVPAGIYAAINKDDLADDVSRVGALLGIATPNFWLGLILILVFALWLDLFPVLPPSDASLLSAEMLWFLILPAVTIGTASTALLMRIMRSSMIEELNKDYVRTARAKGLPERTVILKHVLRNSLISVVTVAALMTASIVDGAVVVEVVFSWPGLGETLVTSIQRRDIFAVQAIILLVGVSVVIANLLADIAYALLDPRIRY